MRVLFVCNMGMQRSPTGARLWKEWFRDETDYMGICDGFDHQRLVEWADVIIVMEQHQEEFVHEIDPEKKVYLLDIEDIYRLMDPKLVNIMKKKLKDVHEQIKQDLFS